jgi:hypothetical protein
MVPNGVLKKLEPMILLSLCYVHAFDSGWEADPEKLLDL